MLRGRRKQSADAVDAALDETPLDPVAERLASLERAFEELSGSSAAAVRVLERLDDPRSTAADVAAAVEVDPVLTAQVLRMANSAGFGLATTVSSTVRAVSVVGFTTVRSLAALAAAGQVGDGHRLPGGFIEHSAAAAAGCVAVSTRFGVQRDEAFSMGLLHDLGWALLDGVDSTVHRALTSQAADTADQCPLEVQQFGMSHPQAAARLLGSWDFPPHVVAAIGAHHEVPELEGAGPPSWAVLRAGDALAHLVICAGAGSVTFEAEDLTLQGFSEEAIRDLAEFTEEYAMEILASLPNP